MMAVGPRPGAAHMAVPDPKDWLQRLLRARAAAPGR